MDYKYNIIIICPIILTHVEPISCDDPMNISKVVYEYTSTSEGSRLTLYCKDNPSQTYTAECYENKTWIPNIALITCGGQSTITVGMF